MTFAPCLQQMTAAAVRGDGAGVAACFTPNGVYHDVFYGSFIGAQIVDLIDGHFHRDATRFRWDLHDPVEAGGIGYARYVFSYTSRIKGHEGRRAVFEGVSICRMQDGLIADYREVANAATGLSLIGFGDARVARFVDREAAALTARTEAASHIDLG